MSTEPRRLPLVLFACDDCSESTEAAWNAEPKCPECGKPMVALREEPPPLFHPSNRQAQHDPDAPAPELGARELPEEPE